MSSLQHWRERLSRAIRHRRAQAVAIGLAALGIAAVAVVLTFQWSWLRAPIERHLSATTGRAVTIAELHGRWDGGPRLRVRGVVVGAADGSDAIFTAREIEAHVAPWPLLLARVELLELGLAGAIVNVERDESGVSNWTIEGKDPVRGAAASGVRKEPLWKTMKIGRLSLSDVVLTVRDAASDAELRLRADSIPPSAVPSPWFTRVEATGRYRKTPFTGRAMTGQVVTLRDTRIPFPFKASLEIARTAIQFEGGMADLLGDTTFDVLLKIAGPSLSTLYPTLPLALPSTPPYRLQGRLRLQEGQYRFDDIFGRIGRSDIRGEGEFATRPVRPLLKAKLRSDHLALADLGALIGVPQSEAERQVAASVLPDANFDLPRMNAINADVTFEARKLVLRPELPFEDLSVRVELVDGVLHLRPLKFGTAGGEMVSTIVLDARQRPLAAEAAVDLRKIEFARLFPTLDKNRLSAGELGAQIRLRGRGQSVAALLSTSSGTVAAAMAGGRISHTVVAAASLDGGKLLPLLVRGDEPVELRCAAISMVVDGGIARSQLMVMDTETARVEGSGAIDLAAERFALELDVQPKKPSILSVRAPLHIQGTFRQPRVSVDAAALLRGGAAIALGVVNPLAALLPLIETGPGDDANCQEVLTPVAPALKQATQNSRQPPPVSATMKPRERTSSNPTQPVR
jgi:uncharacterized protein involved in outer membrane biogenesis